MSDTKVEKEAGPPQEPAAPTQRKREYKEFGHEEEGPTRMLFFATHLSTFPTLTRFLSLHRC